MAKRVAIVALVVVAVVVVGAPFALGMLAESNVRERIEAMNTYPSLSLEVTGYERGWFGSRATVEAALSEAFVADEAVLDPIVAGMLGSVTVPFDIDIGHGPVLTLNGFELGSYAVRASIDPATPWYQIVVSTLGISDLIELRGRTGLFGGFAFEGEIPEFEFNDGEETALFSGLGFTGTFEGSDLSYRSRLEHAAVQTFFFSISLDGIEINGDQTFRPQQVALGDQEVIIERLAAINPLLPTSEVAALEGLRMTATTALNDAGNIDLGASLEAASFVAEGALPMSGLEIGIALTNLDSAAFDELYLLIDQINAVTADPARLQGELLPLVDRIVTAEPVFSLEPMRFTMDGGQFDARLMITLNGDALPTGQAIDLADPAVLMTALAAELELTCDKDLLGQILAFGLGEQMAPQLVGMSEEQIDVILAQQAEQQIALVVAQGMLADNGDTYSTTISLADGVATVNGNPLPLQAMGLF